MSTSTDVVAPRLLALDVGGVLVETVPTGTGWASDFARLLIEDARTAVAHGSSLPTIEQVTADLRTGRDRHDAWKDGDAQGLELSQQGLWALLSQPAWGPALLGHVDRHRDRLTARLCLAWEARELRQGVPQLLDHCQTIGLAVCVVSNTISGLTYRCVLENFGLVGRFANLSFSDEVGIRKPDPGLLLHAVHAAGSTPADTWYVGDTYRRDVACGRRAGVAATILMRSLRTEPGPGDGPRPDVTVEDPSELLALLTLLETIRIEE